MIKKSTKNRFIEIFGWYGAIAIVIGYGLISFNVLNGHSLIYQLLNFTGAIGIIAISFKDKNYQSAILNIIFSLIGLVAITNIITGLAN